MSIFNQLTYYVLVGELAIYLILLIPFTFIPVRARKAAMQFGGKVLKNETVVWISRIVLLLVGGVFVDTLTRLQKLDGDLHRRDSEDGHHHHHDSPLEELQFKSKLFYSQRNMYLSLMSLFMTIVIYRRVKDLYLILHLEDSTDSDKTTIKNLKQQKRLLPPPATTSAKAEKKSDEVIEESEIKGGSSEDPTEAAGMRKRK
ncbi:B-cell receptor-associated protein 31-like-domain-containing protein [Obelidium mucronatum]|nr:B-cell receptor-associated protein 31-like-domain-containing protein [Obelidium mucronatum]